LLAGCSDAEDPREPPPAVDADERMPGGTTTNRLLLNKDAFTRPADNATDAHKSEFFGGNGLFNDPWVKAPASTTTRDGLGPMFNARSCSSCHFKDGRGRPPEDGEPFTSILLRLSVPGEAPDGSPLPEPSYGGQLQPFALPDVPVEGKPRITWAELPGTYGDGTPYTLLEPTYTIDDLGYGPLAPEARISPRVAPAVAGIGLLEAIPLERLQELEDPDDADGDGISGRINWVPDAASGERAAGRFGWKAEQPSIRQQSAGAFLGDMGLSTSLFPEQDCSPLELECREQSTGGAPEISDAFLDRIELYGRLLAVPIRERYRSPQILEGKQLFADFGCGGCHVPEHRTRADAALEELVDQRIFPYTDLLLHDLGEALSDERPVFGANGAEWRTPPLWGLRFYEIVNEHDRLLHDGRARGVAEAVLWHGGEAEVAREAFRTATAEERAALIEFVESL
jgi:CxxC motif-containing protein (DUF1111 family)